MDPEKLHYIGVISNANHSLTRIDFGYGYRVESINVYELIDLLCELYGLPEHEVYYKIEAFFGYQRPKQTIYVIKREWDDWPYLLNNSSDKNPDTWIDDFMSSHNLMDGIQSSINQSLTGISLIAG